MVRKRRICLGISILIVAMTLSSCIPSPDLAWVGSLSLDPPSPAIGDRIHIRQAWGNVGSTSISSEFDIRIEVKRDNILIFEQYLRIQKPIASGEEHTIDIVPEFVVPDFGIYQIIMTLDAKGIIAESRELNNMQVHDSLRVVGFSKDVDMTTAAQAREDIEKYRKGDVIITIVDAEGQPRSDLVVEYTQLEHSFLFGIFCISGDEKVWSLLKQAGLNYAAVWLGWNSVEPEPGIFCTDRDRVHFLQQFDFKGMGHCLIFLSQEESSSIPDYIYELPHEDYIQAIYPHIHKVANEYKGELAIWNIFNEPMLAHTNALGLSEEQTIEVIKEGIRAIRDVDPDAPVLINSYNPGGESPGMHPYDFLQNAIKNDVDFDIIGLEFYYNTYNRIQFSPHPRRSLSSMGELIDEYSTLGKKIHITEIAAPSACEDTMDGYWGEPWSEKLQAEYLESAYTIFFSKPEVEAITWWDATDKNPFIYRGGLLDEKYRAKASYYVLKDLIKTWTTTGMGITDENGQIAFRGFGGLYQIRINDTESGMSKRQEITVKEQEDNPVTIVLD